MKTKMKTAQLFQSGKSQVVCLPKEFRFHGNKAYIMKIGDAVVLLPFDNPWQSLIASLSLFTDDFMAEREQPAFHMHKNVRP